MPSPRAAAFSEDPFEALGDPHRRRILTLLRQSPRSVGELADALPISRPAVSWHLKLLSSAGLVSHEARGTRRIYALEGAGVAAVREYLETLWGDAGTRFRLVADSTSPKKKR